MSNKDDPAFVKNAAQLPNGEFDWGADGLTKREYAAIKIAASLASVTEEFTVEDAAKYGARGADALFAELEKEPT